MKIHRTFTIETELAERLRKENNASGLIEQLLQRHCDCGALDDPDEVQARISTQEAKWTELGASIKALKERLKVVNRLNHKTKSGLVVRHG